MKNKNKSYINRTTQKGKQICKYPHKMFKIKYNYYSLV